MNKVSPANNSLSGVRALTRTAGALLLGAITLAAPISASALEKVSFRTNWFPQAEHGGWYQAATDGTYEKYGLEVDQQPGGPQVNNLQLLLAIEEGLPIVAVASMYQKDPQAIMTHKGVGHDSLEDLKGEPILLSQDAHQSFWPWLKQKYGYTDEQVRPYTFQMGPFIADSNLTQQCYVTSEPFVVQQAGIDPNLFLLSDFGWQSYSTLIVTTTEMVKEHPERVQNFVNASVEGWYRYLNDPSEANAVINTLDANQTPEQLAFSFKEMTERGIVASGDAMENGIGTMNDARWKAASEQLKSIGLLSQDTDYTKAFTTEFVNSEHIKELMAKYPTAQ
jgi:NitT/TauT family transport system substrate-binding protein